MPIIDNERQLPLTDHLDELRARILRALVYVAAGMTVAWTFYPQIYHYLTLPFQQMLARTNGSLQLIDAMEGFMVRAQTSLVGGLIITLPFILLELWAFVRPGLTAPERRIVRILPLSVSFLFVLGAAFAYWMCRWFAEFLLSSYFVLPGMKPMLRIQGTALFVTKVMLAFGLGFQIPILIILLNRLGILPMSVLGRRWREATFAIFTIAAIITPTWDPLSMTIAALPLALLYLGTLGVIALMDRKDRKRAQQDE
jgi:sec-independent protein translocase protein TatC